MSRSDAESPRRCVVPRSPANEVTMTRHLLTVLALLSAASVAAPRAGQAQTFKAEKFDIKGEGGTDYVTVESATGRVFVSRSTHMMVVEGATGKVLGDIPNMPGVHGAGIVTKVGHGFTTNSGDQTVTMFDLKTLAVLKQIKVGPGLDGIMYDESDDKVILTNHSRPIGTLTALDPRTGDIVATVELEDTAPEGAAADGKGHIFVNNEGTNTIQVIDVKTWKATASWPLAPCEGPTGIAYDKVTNRHLLRVRQDVGRGRCEHRQSRRVDPERQPRRRAGLGSVEKADLHSEWRGGERHGRAPGLGRQVHGCGDRPDVLRREDDHRGSHDAQCLPVPARAGSGSAASRWCAASAGGRTRPWSAGPDRRRLVHRHQVMSVGRQRVASFTEPQDGWRAVFPTVNLSATS